jgi:hypothetical protein
MRVTIDSEAGDPHRDAYLAPCAQQLAFLAEADKVRADLPSLADDGESEIGRRCTRRIGKHRQESGPEHRATSQH